MMKDCLEFWGEIRLEQKWVWTLERMGKMEDVELGVFEKEGSHATWRRFQDKWGRSATLNKRFKDKDRWFRGEPRDLREKSNFHITQIWIQMFITSAYILWVETPKSPTQLKVRWNPNKNITKKYKRVLIQRSEANLRSLWRSWTWFHQLLWNPYDDPEPRLHQLIHCINHIYQPSILFNSYSMAILVKRKSNVTCVRPAKFN